MKLVLATLLMIVASLVAKAQVPAPEKPIVGTILVWEQVPQAENGTTRAVDGFSIYYRLKGQTAAPAEVHLPELVAKTTVGNVSTYEYSAIEDKDIPKNKEVCFQVTSYYWLMDTKVDRRTLESKMSNEVCAVIAGTPESPKKVRISP